MLLILKCFTLGSDPDQFYVSLHQDLSRKHFRPLITLQDSVLLQTCSRCKGMISPMFPTQAGKRNYLWRTPCQNIEKAEAASCSLSSILGHMFRSFVNSVPFCFSRSQKPDPCVKVKTTSHGACTLLLFESVNPRPGPSIRRQEIASCYGQCFLQRHQMEYVSSKFQI